MYRRRIIYNEGYGRWGDDTPRSVSRRMIGRLTLDIRVIQ